MSAAVQSARHIPLPWRLIGTLRDIVLGTFLCLTPVTGVLVLGFLVRQMQATVARRWGHPMARPGWILGPMDQGVTARLLGGAAANLRTGLLAMLGLLILTLPFSLAWLGAWWAGWENSFNKGYEQSDVGPVIWMIATAFSLPILAHLPLALAHSAVERRLGAMFEIRRINALARAAGPRIMWLAIVSVGVALPVFGMRVVPVFIEDFVPGFAAMAPPEQANIAFLFNLLAGFVAFVAAWVAKHRAAVIYAKAAKAERSRMGWFWLVLASVIWAAFPVMIVFGQFMNYDAILWLTHPVTLLPWAG